YTSADVRPWVSLGLRVALSIVSRPGCRLGSCQTSYRIPPNEHHKAALALVSSHPPMVTSWANDHNPIESIPKLYQQPRRNPIRLIITNQHTKSYLNPIPSLRSN
ncbi:hypothetical protein HAX54_020062, partial [Datura stramonium]|nr:hypothetical protein [Datura stramonium]